MKADKFQLAYMKMLSKVNSATKRGKVVSEQTEPDPLRESPGFKALVAAGFHDEFEGDPDFGPRLTKDLGGGFRVDVVFDLYQDGEEYVQVEMNSAILTITLENEGVDRWPTVEEAIKALKGNRPNTGWMTGTNFSKAETDAYVRAYEAFDAVEL